MPQLSSWAAILGLSTLSVIGFAKLLATYKHEADQAHKQVAILRSEAEDTRREVKRKDDELAWLRRERSTATEDARTTNDTLTRLTGEHIRAKRRANELETELEASYRQRQTQEEQLQRLTVDLRASTDESRHWRDQLSQTHELLRTRTSELQGAQAFLTKADSVSGTDVKGMVEGLNAEIAQMAAFMADSFEFKRKEGAVEESVDVLEACEQAKEILGDRLIYLLGALEHTDDPMLVQNALQTAMLGISEWVVESWYFEEPEKDHFLQSIYVKVQETEDQAVAGRWRALTQRHIREMIREDSQIPEPLISHFVNNLANILVVAGCKETPPQIHEMITTKFMEGLIKIGRFALRINKARGEDIASCEIEVAYLFPTVKFNPSTMDDAFGRGNAAEEPILCTTDLGLVCAVKEGGVGELRWKETILLKPRVLLESALEEMRNEEGQ